MKLTIRSYGERAREHKPRGPASIESGFDAISDRFRKKLVETEKVLREVASKQDREETWNPGAPTSFADGELREQRRHAHDISKLLIKDLGWTFRANIEEVVRYFHKIMRHHKSLQVNFDKLVRMTTEIIASEATRLWNVVEIERAGAPRDCQGAQRNMRKLSSLVHGQQLVEVRKTLSFIGESTFRLLHSDGRLKAREDEVKENLEALSSEPVTSARRMKYPRLRVWLLLSNRSAAVIGWLP